MQDAVPVQALVKVDDKQSIPSTYHTVYSSARRSDRPNPVLLRNDLTAIRDCLISNPHTSRAWSSHYLKHLFVSCFSLIFITPGVQVTQTLLIGKQVINRTKC